MPFQNENKAQQAAISHVSGPMQVLAGPGSGKTYLTIRRICHLIRNHGISPEHILVITFTKAAAEEMKGRFHQLSQGAWPQVRFGTFHSVFYWMLKEVTAKKRTVISQKEKIQYIRHILKDHGLDSDDLETAEELIFLIGRKKNCEVINKENEILLPSFEEEEVRKVFPEIMRQYCSLLKENGKLDFDDMIGECYELLKKNSQARERFQREFQYVLIDEFQDISPVQYEIVKLLVLPENNLFVVGDDDQSIYGFRGASPSIMQSFMKDYDSAEQILLDLNYRCSQLITKSSALVISKNENRFTKDIKSAGSEEGFFKVEGFFTQELMREQILKFLLQKTSHELNQTAVILRTNIEVRSMAEYLKAGGIPVQKLLGNEPLLSDPLTKDLIAYLNCALKFQDLKRGTDRESFLRIMNKPFRYLSREALTSEDVTQTGLSGYYRNKKAMEPILKKLFSDLSLIARLNPYAAIQYIRKAVGYETFLLEQKQFREREAVIRRLDSIQQTAQKQASLKDWLLRLEELEQCEQRKEEQKGVHVITMHSSKGLEFETVILPDLNEGKVPYRKAITKDQIEEERRLFYVAMTRAKNALYLYYIKGTKEKGIKPSDFIAPFL